MLQTWVEPAMAFDPVFAALSMNGMLCFIGSDLTEFAYPASCTKVDYQNSCRSQGKSTLLTGTSKFATITELMGEDHLSLNGWPGNQETARSRRVQGMSVEQWGDWLPGKTGNFPNVLR
jgi:hypothetical protein